MLGKHLDTTLVFRIRFAEGRYSNGSLLLIENVDQERMSSDFNKIFNSARAHDEDMLVL